MLDRCDIPPSDTAPPLYHPYRSGRNRQRNQKGFQCFYIPRKADRGGEQISKQAGNKQDQPMQDTDRQADADQGQGNGSKLLHGILLCGELASGLSHRGSFIIANFCRKCNMR